MSPCTSEWICAQCRNYTPQRNHKPAGYDWPWLLCSYNRQGNGRAVTSWTTNHVNTYVAHGKWPYLDPLLMKNGIFYQPPNLVATLACASGLNDYVKAVLLHYALQSVFNPCSKSYFPPLYLKIVQLICSRNSDMHLVLAIIRPIICEHIYLLSESVVC